MMQLRQLARNNNAGALRQVFWRLGVALDPQVCQGWVLGAAICALYESRGDGSGGSSGGAACLPVIGSSSGVSSSNGAAHCQLLVAAAGAAAAMGLLTASHW